MSAWLNTYVTALRLYPEPFRRRYSGEMALDFADALADASRSNQRVVGVVGRAYGDLVMSLFREWFRAVHVAIVLATMVVTLALWGMALRPWAWRWDIQPRQHPPSVPVTAGELLVMAAVAMVPVVVVLLFAGRMLRRDAHR